MWDDVPQLRSITGALMSFSVLALLFGAIHYGLHLPGVFPLHTVQLAESPQRVEAQDIQQVVRSEMRGNFFTVDLKRLRLALEQVPWVRNVSVRREFPDRLEVKLEEHQALARWNGTELVNQQGEVFNAVSDQALPEFIGHDGASGLMARQYLQFSRQLAPLKLQIAQIRLSPRHSWQLRLSNGLVLKLGHEQLEQRLAIFTRVYPYSLAELPDSVLQADAGKSPSHGTVRVNYVDMRYRNGFAVRLGRG